MRIVVLSSVLRFWVKSYSSGLAPSSVFRPPLLGAAGRSYRDSQSSGVEPREVVSVTAKDLLGKGKSQTYQAGSLLFQVWTQCAWQF